MKKGPARALFIYSTSIVSLMTLVFFALGIEAVFLSAITCGLWLVWRYDNWTGSCLMIAVLSLLAIGMLFLLIVLLALQPAHAETASRSSSSNLSYLPAY